MPFVSEAQRKFMWAKHPEMAREWESKTTKGKLPEHVEKKAMMNGFFDELQKIAYVDPIEAAKVFDPRWYWAAFGKENEKKKRFLELQNQVEQGASTGAIFGSLPLGLAALGAGKTIKTPAVDSSRAVPFKDLVASLGVKDSPSFADIPDAAGSFFSPHENLVASNLQNPEIVGHELGHAANWEALTKSRLLRLLGSPIVTRLALPGIGAVGGLIAATTEPDSTVGNLAPLIPLATSAPMLADEGIASLRSIKALGRMAFSPEEMSLFKRNLAKAFATYGLGAAAAIAPVLAARLLIHKEKSSR